MLYTCDACHYTFSVQELPTSCPDCGKKTVQKKYETPDGKKLRIVPAVRPASEAERTEHLQIEKSLDEEKQFLSSLNDFGDVLVFSFSDEQAQPPQPPLKVVEEYPEIDEHGLNFNEHNLIIMLLFYFRGWDTFNMKNKIWALLNGDTESKVKLLTDIRRFFTSSLNKEEKANVCRLHYAMWWAHWLSLNEVPTQGPVRNVKPSEMADAIGQDGALRTFLVQWHNSL